MKKDLVSNLMEQKNSCINYLKAFTPRNASHVNILSRNKMADGNLCTNGKKCILRNRKFSQFPLQRNLLRSEVSHFGLTQMLLLLVSSSNLAIIKKIKFNSHFRTRIMKQACLG